MDVECGAEVIIAVQSNYMYTAYIILRYDTFAASFEIC